MRVDSILRGMLQVRKVGLLRRQVRVSLLGCGNWHGVRGTAVFDLGRRSRGHEVGRIWHNNAAKKDKAILIGFVKTFNEAPSTTSSSTTIREVEVSIAIHIALAALDSVIKRAKGKAYIKDAGVKSIKGAAQGHKLFCRLGWREP